MQGRTGGHKCCTKQKVRKGLWSPDEDEKLFNFISSNGHSSWSSVPKLAGLQRCGKSCRLRWLNYLRPDLKRGGFTHKEERTIIEVHRMLGNKWAQIAKHLPGRTDNEIKNFWNSYIKKKLISQGVDPNTHNQLKLISSSKSISASSYSSSASSLVFNVTPDQTTSSNVNNHLPTFFSFHVDYNNDVVDTHPVLSPHGLWGYGPGLESNENVIVQVQPTLIERKVETETDHHDDQFRGGQCWDVAMDGGDLFEGSNLFGFDFEESAVRNNNQGLGEIIATNYGVNDDELWDVL